MPKARGTHLFLFQIHKPPTANHSLTNFATANNPRGWRGWVAEGESFERLFGQGIEGQAG